MQQQCSLTVLASVLNLLFGICGRGARGRSVIFDDISAEGVLHGDALVALKNWRYFHLTLMYTVGFTTHVHLIHTLTLFFGCNEESAPGKVIHDVLSAACI